jgi:hypothetical protein
MRSSGKDEVVWLSIAEGFGNVKTEAGGLVDKCDLAQFSQANALNAGSVRGSGPTRIVFGHKKAQVVDLRYCLLTIKIEKAQAVRLRLFSSLYFQNINLAAPRVTRFASLYFHLIQQLTRKSSRFAS